MATVLTEMPACPSLTESILALPSTTDSRPPVDTTAGLADIVLEGLDRMPKTLPPWLFYDQAGSELFEQITCLPEYYLTRVERGIFEQCAPEMIAAAAGTHRLRLLELGAGSADKTRLLLAAALAHQGSVAYQPVDVSESALESARDRLQAELPEVLVQPQVADYTRELRLEPCSEGERRLVLYIGSSIGNFEPESAAQLLQDLRGALEPGDFLLLGVDLAPTPHGKSVADLIAAYYDSAGVTGHFNKNLLTRLNRELGAEFEIDAFRHRIRWNGEDSRIEMHLESCCDQTVSIAALERSFEFAAGETIHTENSYKYRPGDAEELLGAAGFEPEQRWMDQNGWFAVYLASRV